jgi:HEAT repeat protein
MRWILILVLSIGSLAGSSIAIGQDRAHLESLLTKLDDADSARAASTELRAIAQQDLDSRQYIANRLPALIAIGAQGDVQLWISSLELTANLKVVEAVPLLTELLKKDNRGIATSFGAAERMYDDPVAKALSEIGDPATQPVARLFSSGDLATRRRATIVLWNIGTPLSRKSLLDQIEREPDQELRSFMQSGVK